MSARHKSPAWCGPAAALQTVRQPPGAAAATTTATAGGGVILLPPPSPAPIFVCRCGYMSSPPPLGQCPVCGRNGAPREPSDKAAPSPSGSDHRRRPGKVGSCGGELPACPEADGVGERADDGRERPAPTTTSARPRPAGEAARGLCSPHGTPAEVVTHDDNIRGSALGELGPGLAAGAETGGIGGSDVPCRGRETSCGVLAGFDAPGLHQHDADTCPDCGAGLCAELVSYDPGTGETMYEARDYCAACGLVPAIRPAAAAGASPAEVRPAAAPRDDYDFSPPVFADDDIAF